MNRFAIGYAAIATPLVGFALWIVINHESRAEGAVQQSPRAIVVPPGAGRIGFPGEWKLTAQQGSGAYSMVEIKVPKNSKLPPGPAGHVHTREDESWYIIDGELQFEVGDETVTAGPGSLVYAPRNVPHSYRVVKAPARYLLMFTPAGIEPLFAEVAELRKRYPNEGDEYHAELEKVQAKYGARPAKGWVKPSERAPGH